MELQQLRYFLDAAETQHITESAERLHIAQPALSQAIHRLEDSVGVPLFMSKGRNIILTEYGKYLKDKLIPIITELDNLPKQLREMAVLENETLRLNVLAASELVAEAVIEYKYNRKDLNFKFMQSRGGEEYDIEITTEITHRADSEKRNNNFICSEKIYLAVPKGEKYKRFSERNTISLRDAAEEDFISLAGVKQFRYICDKYCFQAGIRPRVIFESDNSDTVKNMIAAELGVGFWPEFTWGATDSERVRLIEIYEPRCSRDIIVNYNLNKTDNRNVLDFFDFLKEFFIRKKRETE